MEKLASLASISINGDTFNSIFIALASIPGFIFNLLTLFFYPLAITLGVLFAKEFIKYLHDKRFSKNERVAEEIKELNGKMHDRLVEVAEEITINKQSKNFHKIITRIRYNASRLKKYDEVTFNNVLKLVGLFSSDFGEEKEVIRPEKIDEAKKLIESIKDGVDKLYLN